MGLLLFGLMGVAISICLLCLHFETNLLLLGQWEIFFFPNEIALFPQIIFMLT